MVTAMPVTWVSGFPALNVSTVSEFHGTPMFFWIAATTSRAVGPLVLSLRPVANQYERTQDDQSKSCSAILELPHDLVPSASSSLRLKFRRH